MKARQTPNKRAGHKLPSTAEHLNFTYKCIQQIIILGCACPARGQTCNPSITNPVLYQCYPYSPTYAPSPQFVKVSINQMMDGFCLPFYGGRGGEWELRSCVGVEVAVLGSPSLINKPHGFCGHKATLKKKGKFGAQELCARWGGHPGLPVPNKPYGFCGRKATPNREGRAVTMSGSVADLPNFLLSL